MKIGPIDFPEPLLAAQRSGSLVIFAGAGVSMAPPSSLPDLKTIASHVARGSEIHREKGEPIDRFLGRLDDSGVPVHREVCRMMADPASRPTPMHYDLLRLFPSGAEVRLVTTNFDAHFSTAARELYGDQVEIFYAPALPLGHQAEGLIYLHGSVEKDPDRIVVTDNDFGRAYLTEGWARRFLQTLLASFTVLFVGYSHNDPVMNYLARGLPPEVRDLAHHREVHRFALAPEEGPSHWRFVGINPVRYPMVQGENRHAALGEAIAAWVDLLRTGELDHDRRVRSILEGSFPPDQESADYLKAALEGPATAEPFFRYARSPQWLRWAAESGVFERLADPDSEDPMASRTAEWFAESYVYQHPAAALAMAQKIGPRMNRALWRAIVHRLASGDQPRPAPELMDLWVALLLRSPEPEEDERLLDSLLATCGGAREEVMALMLFEHRSRPRLEIEVEEPGIGASGEERPRVKVGLEGDVEQLRRAWAGYFRPRLATLCKPLETILSSHLLNARLLLWPGRLPGEEDLGQLSGSGEVEPSYPREPGPEMEFLLEAARELSGVTPSPSVPGAAG